MRPLPQNAVSFSLMVVVEDAVVLDEEGVVLVSWSSPPSANLRSVDVSVCELGPAIRIMSTVGLDEDYIDQTNKTENSATFLDIEN